MPGSPSDASQPHKGGHPTHRKTTAVSHSETHTPRASDNDTHSRGERLVRLGWFLVGTTFLLLCVFTAVTIFVKVSRSHDREQNTQSVAENREEPLPDNELLRAPTPVDDRSTTGDHLVQEAEAHRVLGSGFAPPPPDPTPPPPLNDPSPLPPPPKIEPDKTPPPKIEPDKTSPASKPSVADLDAAFEKRVQAEDEEGRTRLLSVPELRLFSDLEVEAFRDQETKAQTGGGGRFPVNSVEYAFNVHLSREMLKAGTREGLPLQLGPSALMDLSTASIVQTLSKNLRDLGFVSVPGAGARVISPGFRRVVDPRTGKVISAGVGGGGVIENATANDKMEAFKSWCDENRVETFRGALPTLLQMLQVEDVPTRLVLVRELAKVKGAGGSAALAKRALVDLSPEVRDAALAELAKRPSGQYLPVLMQGLTYPWPPVADHSALALRKLKPEGAVPRLVDLLDRKDPSLPILDAKGKVGTVRELVRLNHMRNCLLCHAPSANDKDGLVRGLVPTPGQPLPRLYYAGQAGNFVRADTTFLRQDFSVNLPVKAAAPWPDEQRFDLVTRVRRLKPEEVTQIAAKPNGEYPQRDAVRYALRGLTGKDGGDSSETWRALLGITKDKDKPADIDKSTKKAG